MRFIVPLELPACFVMSSSLAPSSLASEIPEARESMFQTFFGMPAAFAMMIHVCWRPHSDKKGRVGFIAEFEVREESGRRVSGCRGFVGKKQWGKGFILRPTAPVLFEQEPDAWLALDADIRKIVSDLFVALLEAVEKGPSIFVQSKLPAKPERGRPLR
jgi:hypothetical protein